MAFSSSKITWQGSQSLTPQRTRFYSWGMEWALLPSLRLVSWKGSRWTNQEKNMSSAGKRFNGPRSLRPTTSTNKSQTPLGQQRHFSAGLRPIAVRLGPRPSMQSNTKQLVVVVLYFCCYWDIFCRHFVYFTGSWLIVFSWTSSKTLLENKSLKHQHGSTACFCQKKLSKLSGKC